MGIISGTAFWIMCTLMWLLATPTLVDVINGANLSGIELFLMTILPWVVLLCLVGKVLSVLRNGGDTA